MKSLTKPKTAVIVCIVCLAILLCVLSLACFQAVADTAQTADTEKSTANSETENNTSDKASDKVSDKISDKVVDNKTTGTTDKTIEQKADKNKKTDSVDAKNVDAKNKATKLAQNSPTGIKEKTTAVESIDSGWTAIVPNKEEVKREKLEAGQELRVAEQKTGTAKNLTNDGGNGKVGIWDALPENVTKNNNTLAPNIAQPQPQKTDTNSTSPFSDPSVPSVPSIPPVPPSIASDPELGLPALTPSDELPTPPADLPTPPVVLPKDSVDELHEPPPITPRVIGEGNNKSEPTPEVIDDEIKEPKKTPVKPIFSTRPETGADPAKAGIDENAAQKSLTDIQSNSADEITRRLDAIAAEKMSLEKMLQDAIDKANKEAGEPEDSEDEDVGISRSGKQQEAQTPTETENQETKTTEAEKPQSTDTESEYPKTEPVEGNETESGADAGNEGEGEVDNEPLDWDAVDAVDEPRKKLIDPRRVGDSDGVAKLKLMYEEVMNGLKSRNIMGKYERWKEYARTTLRNSSGLNTGSELDGRSRLSWYKKLYNEPIYSVFEAEEFTRQLHDGLSGNHRLIAESMGIIREKLDVPARNDSGITFPKCETPLEAVGEVKRALIAASMHHARAVSTLTSAEQTELVGNLVQTFVGPGCVNGHTIPSRTYGRKLLDMLEKIDKSAMHDAAEAFIPLVNLSLIELLDKLPENALPSTLIGGQTFQKLTTSAGDIIIGGRENNAYDLDSPDFRDVICIIDLGGNDSYRDGTCGLHRPVMLIIDLHGDDVYTATRPGVQGGSILGVSVLIDVEGDDRYNAVDVAQGSSI
ncbi:MAG: hypothetical protein LBL39_06175, partial [Planctomycetaceae bacterium]|nr:hypothetical protein [Planctomycetaceae bacterium]